MFGLDFAITLCDNNIRKRTGQPRKEVPCGEWIYLWRCHMEYEKGYVFDLMENGGPTDVREL